MDKVSVALVQNLLFRVGKNKKVMDRNVAEISFGHTIKPKTAENWKREYLIIPAVCHSTSVQKQFQTQTSQSTNQEVATISWPVNEESPLELGEVNFIQVQSDDTNESSEIDSKLICKIIEIGYDLVLTIGSKLSCRHVCVLIMQSNLLSQFLQAIGRELLRHQVRGIMLTLYVSQSHVPIL